MGTLFNRLQHWERICGALICFLGLGDSISTATEAELGTNRITAATVLADLHYPKPVAVHLLAFTSREDKRPWYVDDALLLLELPKNEWMLVHAVRNPRYPSDLKRKPSKWTAHDVMDAPYVGDRTFKHRPTRREMDRFLKDNDWQAESDKYSQVIQSDVDEAVWQKILGYPSPWMKAQNQKGANTKP